jgi:hypothetical protein
MQIHGNPGDYAWGRGGLDAIITQVNHLKNDGTGLLIQIGGFFVAALESDGWCGSPTYGAGEYTGNPFLYTSVGDSNNKVLAGSGSEIKF